MNGLRALEMAAGAWAEVISKRRTEGIAALLKETHVVLATEDWTRIAADFDKGMAAFSGIIGVKCAFWAQLPWYSCVMLHWDEKIARHGARYCLDMWQGLSEEAKNKLPPFLHNFLGKPMVRAQLQRWVAKEVLRAELPREVLSIMAPLTFVPIAERVIEGHHSIIKKRVGYARAGPVACSMALRSSSLLEHILHNHPGQFENLVQSFEEARHLRSFARARGPSAPEASLPSQSLPPS